MKGLLKNEAGQMTVELAVTLPILVIVMVIAADLMWFMQECARFDQSAPQAVLGEATSPGYGEYDSSSCAARVEAVLTESFSAGGEKVSVSCSEGTTALGACTFTCTLAATPWPLPTGSLQAFGVTLPTALTHESKLVVDPFDAAVF